MCTYSTVKSERLSEEAASSTIMVSSGLAYGHGLSTSQAGRKHHILSTSSKWGYHEASSNGMCNRRPGSDMVYVPGIEPLRLQWAITPASFKGSILPQRINTAITQVKRER